MANYNIKPCDITKPYVFVSYSSRDKEVVYKDVVKLQEMGYNIWIDKELALGHSWKEQVFEVIGGKNCKVVMFYVSQNSLSSVNCWDELYETRDLISKAKYRREEEVYFIPIDVEVIDDLNAYIVKNLESIIENIKSSSDEKRNYRDFQEFLKEFFGRGINYNNTARIAKNIASDVAYFDKITRELDFLL